MAYDYTYETERPQLAVLRYINPAAFSPHHLQQLYRLEKHAWDGSNAVTFARRIAEQSLWLWEVGDDDNHAIVLTSVDFPFLYLEGLAGNGVLAQADDIINDLRVIARFYGCNTIRTTSERSAFASVADKYNFRAVATVWDLEVENGRQGPEDNAEPNAEG